MVYINTNTKQKFIENSTFSIILILTMPPFTLLSESNKFTVASHTDLISFTDGYMEYLSKIYKTNRWLNCRIVFGRNVFIFSYSLKMLSSVSRK